MRKLFFALCILSAALFANAADIDAVCSYFTVSRHNIAPGRDVQLTINLRNTKNRPTTAETIKLQLSNPAVKVVAEPAPVAGKSGVYTAVINAATPAECNILVIADGVVVEENVLDNSGFENSASGYPVGISTYANHYDSTYFYYGSNYEKAQRGRHYVGCINFNKGKSIYWGFGRISGKNLLPNHAYIYSVYAKYNNIRGERGVSINTSQYNSNEKNLFHQYAGFRNGTSDGWVKIESEPQKIVKGAVQIGASAMILVAAGEVDFDNARVKLSPTVSWGSAPEGVCAPVSKPVRCLIPNYKRIDYAAAIQKEYAECKKLLSDAVAKYGKGSALIKKFESDLADCRAKMVKGIHPKDAYQLQLYMEKLAAEFTKNSAKLAAGDLDDLLGGSAKAAEEIAYEETFVSTIQGGCAVEIDSEKINIDGNFDEAVWKKAQKLTDFRRTADKKVVTVPTIVMAAYDKQNLYLAWDMTGKPEKLRANGGNDSNTVFMDETIELFVSDPKAPMSYRQIVLTPGNIRWDALDRDKYINFNFQSATIQLADGWRAEMALPWKELNIDPLENRIIRINFCRSRHPDSSGIAGVKDPRDLYESCAWSLRVKGFHELGGFGFLVLGEPQQAFTAVAAAAKKDAARYSDNASVKKALAMLEKGNAAEIVDYQNRIAFLYKAVKKAETEKSAMLLAENSQRSQLVLSNWDESVELEAAPEFQIPLLASKIRNQDPAKLNFRMAVNEFAHRSFLISAVKKSEKITFNTSALIGKGAVIPASKVTVQRILFLTPEKELWPSSYSRWSKRPLPELVEDVDEPFDMEKYTSVHIRVLINTADVKPGKYSGRISVAADGKNCGTIPIDCEVLPIVLPDSRNNPLWIYAFTGIPYPGKSGRAWAEMLRNHYVSDVSFETPRIYLNGKRLIPPPHIKDSKTYIEKMVNPGIDFSGDIKIDGDFGDFAERIQICAEYGLKPVFSTRTEDIYPEVFPAFIKFLGANGLAADRFYYKTGDEDTSLWQYPLAEKLHQCAAEIPLYMIPSGSDYFDLKPLAKHYKYIAFTRSGLSNPAFEKDLRIMQKNGVKLARYTNRTSWAERDVRLAGRDDLWDVMISDKMDGYQVWTACVTGEWLGYRYAYGDAKRTAVHNYLPEQQSITQLVYVRKKGDFFKPVSCIRLEDMRDGITDYLYYKAAEKALYDRKDNEAEKKLAAVRNMPRKTPQDFAAIRNVLINLILQ